jgi:hypothetical protein
MFEALVAYHARPDRPGELHRRVRGTPR